MSRRTFGRRHPLIRTLLVLLLVLVVVFIGLASYLQTRHAFQYVVLPLVTRLLPGELRVGDGSLSFPATLEAADVSYTRAEGGLSLQIDRLLVRVSVSTSIRQRILLVEQAEIDGGRLAASSEPSMTSPGESRTSIASPARLPPIGFRHISLKNLALMLKDGANAFHLQNLDGTIRDLEIGRTGTIDLHSDFTFEEAAGQGRWATGVAISGAIEQSPDGSRLTWNGRGEVLLREWPGETPPSDSPPFILEETMTGHFDGAASALDADAALLFRQGDASLGRAFLQLSRTSSTGHPVTDVGITVSELSDKMLDLWLKRAGSFRITSTHLSGYVHIRGADERYDVRSTFSGQNLQAAVGSEVTPPVDIDMAQAGAFDLGSRAGVLDIFQVRIANRRHVWLAGELSDSLRIDLGSEGHQPVLRSSTNGEWRVVVNDIDVEEMRPWANALGWSALEGFRAGRLGGAATVSGYGQTGVLDLHMHLAMSDVRLASADEQTAAALMTFAHDIQATMTKFRHLQLTSWTTTATINDRSVGTAHVSGALDLGNLADNPRLEGSLKLANLPGEALNPLLSLWTPVRVERTRFSGDADVTLSGTRMDWTIDVRGHQFSLRLPRNMRPTSPLELVLTTSGGYDLSTRVLKLNRLSLREVLQKRLVIAASLDNPVQFTFQDQGNASQRTASGDAPGATIAIDVHQLEMDELRPRLAAWGISTLDSVKAGALDGHWTAHWREESRALSVSGHLDVTRLRLEAAGIRIDRPLEIRSRMDGTLTGFSVLELKNVELEALDGAHVLASVKLAGTSHGRTDTTDLAGTFISNSLPRLADRLGLLDARQRKLINRGRLRVEAQLGHPGDGQPLSVHATVHARDIRFQPVPGQFLTYSILGEGGGVVSGDGNRIEFNDISLGIQSQGKAVGTLRASGVWPLRAAASDGRLEVQATGLDMAPFVDLFDYLPGRNAGPLPTDAQVTLRHGGDGRMLTLRGQETIGPIHLLDDTQHEIPQGVTLHLHHDLVRDKDDLHIVDLTLTADRPGSRSDRVALNGHADLAGHPSTTIKGDVAALDAAWYASLLSRPESHRSTEKQRQSAHEPRDGQRASDDSAVLMSLNTDISIGTISYGVLTVGPGRLTSHGDGQRQEVRLAPTNVADGQVEATVTIEGRQPPQDIRWSGKGQGLRVETLLAAIEPRQELSLTGSGSFVTSGSGTLHDEPARKHFNGTADVTVADGRFLRARGLHFLANYTKIDELETLGFDTSESKLRLEDGVIHIDRFSLVGPTASFEGKGAIAQDNTVDARILVRIGPLLGKKIKVPCMSALLAMPDGFTTLPFALRITGPLSDRQHSIDTAALDYMKESFGGVVDTMKHLLQGCRDK
ncbi:hypothetical protein YTPLAS18_28500 [Nitrospira sp.]|nr:hypothetical protein YTPLAS18_28500 [Nitrospira sp.]